MVVALLGLGALAVGSLGPWATTFIASVSGTQGDGKLTLGAVALLLGRGGSVFAALVALVALGICIYDLVNVSHKAAQITVAGVQVAHVGWGLYTATGGAAVALIGAIAYRLSRARPSAGGTGRGQKQCHGVCSPGSRVPNRAS